MLELPAFDVAFDQVQAMRWARLSQFFSAQRQHRQRLVMKVESAGSYILEGSDPQESHLNKLGVKLGAGLRRVAQEGLDTSAGFEPYLNTKEFGWDRRSTGRWATEMPVGSP